MIRISSHPRFPLPLGVLLAALAAVASSGCSQAKAEPTAEQIAEATFLKFQNALFAKDRRSLRPLLCSDSRQVVDALLQADLANKVPLEVTGVTRSGFEFRVHVVDGNDGGRKSFYLLAIEDGAMRVDMLGTARHNSTTTIRRLDQPTFVPTRMTPEQLELARKVQADAAANR